MDDMKEPGIRLESVILAELHFKRLPTVPTELTYQIEINSTPVTNPEKKYLEEKLSVKVKSVSGDFVEASCLLIGKFSCINGCENMTLDEFAKENAPSIIYPFCREALATVSVRGGIAPILLPPFNFHAVNRRKQDDAEDMSSVKE